MRAAHKLRELNKRVKARMLFIHLFRFQEHRAPSEWKVTWIFPSNSSRFIFSFSTSNNHLLSTFIKSEISTNINSGEKYFFAKTFLKLFSVFHLTLKIAWFLFSSTLMRFRKKIIICTSKGFSEWSLTWK